METNKLAHYIIKNADRLGINICKPGIKVLDFGCGQGSSIIELRAVGIDAYGVDIVQSKIDAAKNKLSSQDNNIKTSDVFRTINQNIPFEDNTFDYIFSNQVLEHVENLDKSANEIARVLKTDGFYYSASPAKFKIIEPHIFVPFAHWLPAGKFRSNYLSICFYLGIGKNNGLDGKQQDLYLKKHTYYRSTPQLTKTLNNYFKTVKFVGWHQLHCAINEKVKISIPAHSVLDIVAETLISTFHEHRILMSNVKQQ